MASEVSAAKIARHRRPEPMSAEERRREEEFLLNASLERRNKDIASINHYRRGGMSRKRLIYIYGAELVDAVLGFDDHLA